MTSQFHGLLLVDKPAGMTSHDVVARVRRILNIKSVGHAGTLDPMATGLMALLIGEGTKLSQYILEGDKAYIAEAKLGVKTDTLDITGNILEENAVNVSEQQVQETCLALQGEFDWTVPLFSAVKVQGKKLYEYAREEKPVVRPIKKMTFYKVSLLGQQSDTVKVKLECSKGSYVRSWIQELGSRLGTGACMSYLQRVQSFPFDLKQALSLEDLTGQVQRGEFSEAFIPMESALPNTKSIRVQGMDQTLIHNGQISNGLKIQLISAFDPDKDEVIKILSHSTGQLLALVGLERGQGFVIRRVFRY